MPVAIDVVCTSEYGLAGDRRRPTCHSSHSTTTVTVLQHFLCAKKLYKQSLTQQDLPIKGGQLQPTHSMQDTKGGSITMHKPTLIVSPYFQVLALV
jgi:hypothetical protein